MTIKDFLEKTTILNPLIIVNYDNDGIFYEGEGNDALNLLGTRASYLSIKQIFIYEECVKIYVEII